MDEFLFSDFSEVEATSYVTEYRDHPLKRAHELLSDINSSKVSEKDPAVNEVINSDALAKLLSTAQNPTQVTFEYNEYEVTITNSERIKIEKK
ncbi:hypothetical protein G9464_10465 [Halostella sp. JP-L12]|uniref:HalOD1 output domain-containing protein n=1 Tax=Halostella TaxID=1843185 RepID=UPI0013CED014|nr:MULTISPECIES: HalOD1 output domain-containing protein [Halostella]NHN48019.1 hypothetical protein [Halostella sp. JP-L12]